MATPTTSREPEGPRRRIPKQARARERVERILDAARAELESRPVAEITTEAIAERAGVPVGSVYQYFASKAALLAAVAEAVMDAADSEAARQIASCRDMTWRDAVEATIRATFAVLRDNPDYRRLLRSIRFTPEFAEVTAASNQRVADLMSLHPAFSATGLPRARNREICATAVTAANALQDRALSSDEHDFESLVEETRRLVVGYLSTYLA